ncbi:MAG: arylesterase, partial [Rhodobacteraceae bacterium]|nr:arylesterase [Paracoccaceae bacterium]
MGGILCVGRSRLYEAIAGRFKAMLLVLLLLASALPATAGPKVIAALGDSLTQGFGLQNVDGFVPRLQAWLQGQGADISAVS